MLATIRFTSVDVTHVEMQEIVAECLERMRYNNAQHFVFDLSTVEFLASACLGALVGFMQEVEHVRGKIALVNCHDNVAFLFKVTRLDHVFEMYDDVQEAVASF